MIKWLSDLYWARGNRQDLEDMSERLSAYLEHTCGLSKSNYTIEGMCAAFDEARESDLREYLLMTLNDMGLLSDQEYFHKATGIADMDRENTSALHNLRIARNRIRAVGDEYSEKLIDGAIEEIEAGMKAYV